MRYGSMGVFPADSCRGLPPEAQVLLSWIWFYRLSREENYLPPASDIAEDTGMTRQRVSRWLTYLYQNKFIEYEYINRNTAYSIKYCQLHRITDKKRPLLHGIPDDDSDGVDGASRKPLDSHGVTPSDLAASDNLSPADMLHGVTHDTETGSHKCEHNRHDNLSPAGDADVRPPNILENNTLTQVASRAHDKMSGSDMLHGEQLAIYNNIYNTRKRVVGGNQTVHGVTPFKIGQYASAWVKRFGGLFPFAAASRGLRKLHELHGDKLLPAWIRYCNEVEPKFASVHAFMRTPIRWMDGASQKTTNIQEIK